MKGTRTPIEVSIAISDAVKLCNVDVISAYPITPQTHIVEHLSEICAEGELNAEFVKVESEQTAMAACIGAAAMGARTFTATSSQGLALMSEIVYIVPALRFPIVMALANRALSGPLSIWNDHSDVMSIRDCGWIQMFAENGQEAFDLMIMAYRIAEDHRILLPAIVNFDGFILSHIIEPIYILSQADVNSFLPPYDPVHKLDPSNPLTMGAVGVPEIYTEARKVQWDLLEKSESVVKEVFSEFQKAFGREYHAIETYQMEDAEVALVTMGGISETARSAIDGLRKQGKKVGLIRIRLWRPFPFKDFLKAVSGTKALGIIDRAISFGGPGGPVFSEIRSALYDIKDKPKTLSFIAGLGGRDITVPHFEQMVEKTFSAVHSDNKSQTEMIGLRE